MPDGFIKSAPNTKSIGMISVFLAVIEHLVLLPLKWIVREIYLDFVFVMGIPICHTYLLNTLPRYGVDQCVNHAVKLDMDDPLTWFSL